MKKILIALMAAALIMGFAMVAAAADEESDPCDYCKCPVWNINCGLSLGQQGAQCSYFDWDDADQTVMGWACLSNLDLSKIQLNPGTAVPPEAYLGRDCRLSFYVCDCEKPEDFTEVGDTIGFRFTITTGDGVYFMGDPVWVKTYTSQDLVCKNWEASAREPEEFVCDGGTAAPNGLLYLKTPGVASSAVKCTDLFKREDWTGLKDSCEPTTSEAPRVKQICTGTDSGYIIEADDIGAPYLVLDVPAMYLVKSEIVPGQTVKVLAELLTGSGGMCPSCQSVCECEIEVGIMCCDDSALMGGCLYFPYVVGKDANWGTGIALTNLGGVSIADMEVTVTFTDKNGVTLSKTLTDFSTSIVTWVLDADTFTALGMGSLAAGPMMMRIETNFPADAYEFIILGGFGGSTMARPCAYQYDWAVKGWMYNFLAPLLNAGF